MSLFGEKDASIEEVSRHNRIKKAITAQVSSTLKSLHMDQGVGGGGSSTPTTPTTPMSPRSPAIIYSGDLPVHLCLCMEAVFLHGLKKAKFAKKLSGYFGGSSSSGSSSSSSGSSDSLSYSFWPFVVKFTHKDTVAQLQRRSPHLKTEVGLCRAWVRVALNEGLLESYLAAMLTDSGSTASHYNSTAYLRDAEQPGILLGLLRGVGELTFALSYNMPSLNAWTTSALAMAGIVESVSSSVVSIVSRSADEVSTVTSKKEVDVPVDVSVKSASANNGQTAAIQDVTDKDTAAFVGIPFANSTGDVSVAEDCQNEDALRTSEGNLLSIPQSANPDACAEAAPQRVHAASEDSIRTALDDRFVASSPVAVERCVTLPRNMSSVWAARQTAVLEPVTGNSLGSLSGWATAMSSVDFCDNDSSSDSNHESDGGRLDGTEESDSAIGAPLEDVTSALDQGVSFQDLIRDYRPANLATGQATVAFGSGSPGKAASIIAEGSSGNGSEQRESSSPLVPSVHPFAPDKAIVEKDYEVVDLYDAPMTEDLDALYGKICNEKGLDSQNYQCKNCARPIGIVYGAPRVCTYDGCYYCTECHLDEEYVVPAKIIYNWDFKRYRVATRCKAFLQSSENQPLISVSQLNAKLYEHAAELEECRVLRVELCYLKKYLFLCARQVAEELKKRVWPSEFLYENSDAYSLACLGLVTSGQLAALLRKAVNFAKAHVYDCPICLQKGFFCELCGSSKVIFPFETDTTVKCEKCSAVYHKTCRKPTTPCPKCTRIQKRQSVLGGKDAGFGYSQLY